jgi:predicted ATPase
VQKQSQFIIATHSPILLAYAQAMIYQFSEHGIQPIEYQDTEHYQLTRAFLNNPDRMLQRLLDDTA